MFWIDKCHWSVVHSIQEYSYRGTNIVSSRDLCMLFTIVTCLCLLISSFSLHNEVDAGNGQQDQYNHHSNHPHSPCNHCFIT